jgi:hypothetical protein
MQESCIAISLREKKRAQEWGEKRPTQTQLYTKPTPLTIEHDQGGSNRQPETKVLWQSALGAGPGG